MTWFKATPASKIINVFVTDYSEVDQLMGLSVNAFLQNFIRLNVGLVIILYKTYFTAPTLILVHFSMLYVLRSFLKTDRSFKQIVVKNRSHMVTKIMETHAGLLHFRNSNLLDYIKSSFYSVHDVF